MIHSPHTQSVAAEGEDSKAFETVPTFYPTLEEMRDFDKYLLKLHEVHHCEKIGLTKLVPPKEWEWRPSMDQARGMRVKNPIQQCISGNRGAFNVYNIVKKDLLLGEYEKIALAQRDLPTDEDFADLSSIERRFWKSLTTTGVPPLYGSDVEGTLFGNADVAFNVNTLDCCLKRAGIKIPGVTNPMMYVGMWRSFFPFHTEDVNMFSTSVMHLGKPKFWYGIPPECTERVIALARSLWPSEAKTCAEFMRHKTIMISPTRLEQAGIPFVRAVQREREIIITWPSCFHGGFNSGFNVAEAVNFCPQSLIPLFLASAKTAGFCKCRPDSVVINTDWLETRLLCGTQEENWVQCEECQKWRKLPTATMTTTTSNDNAATAAAAAGGQAKDIAEHWTCSMNTWDARFASCQAPEESTDTAPTYPSREEALRSTPLDISVGERVGLLMDNDEWVLVRVMALVDGFARLHHANTLSSDDEWVDLRSERLAKMGAPTGAVLHPPQPPPPQLPASPKKKRVKTEEEDNDEEHVAALLLLVPPPPPPRLHNTEVVVAALPSPATSTKQIAMEKRNASRELISAHLDQVRQIFTSQQLKSPYLECVRTPKHQWTLPPDWPVKLVGITGLRTVDQAFEVIFRSVIVSQKLIGIPATFRDPRDASEVHQKLIRYFESLGK